MATNGRRQLSVFYFITMILKPLIFLSIQSFSLGSETDRQALLSFKQSITDDPLQTLLSWNDSSSFCNWAGVTCSLNQSRVIVLSLPSKKLAGSLSPAITNLSFLESIDLRENSFRGQIPGDISRLVRLQNIYLSNNYFEGEIPDSLSQCSELRVINFNRNNLTGKIPTDISKLPNLVALHISANSLTGGIPPVLGNLSSLVNLSIGVNFLGGSIPNDLGRLANLEFLQLSNNNLTGEIPASIFNLSRMSIFAMAYNNLTGELPQRIGSYFPKLKEMHLGMNLFTGVIPASISDISSLQIIDIPDNGFHGKVPDDLGRLPDLRRLNVGRNKLGGEDPDGLKFIDSLIHCRMFGKLSIDDNLFTGSLPESIGNLSTTVYELRLGINRLSGQIPPGITNLVNLTKLEVHLNSFDGPIFPDVGKLVNLRELHMYGNKLSGSIPSTIGNLTRLSELRLDGNSLDGSIPSSLGKCQQLNMLNLSNNNLSGFVPVQVFDLSQLTISLNMAHNSLSGSFPEKIGNFMNLKEFDVSDNEFSGSVPEGLGNCVSLENVYLEGNSLSGSIPSSLSALKNLQDLDLSRNSMTGIIPEFLQDFVFLRYINLSFNKFEGDVPKRGIFSNRSAVSLNGNNRLCGGIAPLGLPSCSLKRDSRIIKLVIGVVIGVLSSVLMLFLFIYMMHRRSTRGSFVSLSQDWSSTFSYKELEKATNGFSSENFLGEGSFASVYYGILSEEPKPVAVKVLNVQQKGISKTYMTECEALRNIRHRNLVKILGFCATLDSLGRDFKAIVLEFMPCGTLDQWIHPQEKSQVENLNIFLRLSIAIDIASALEYLHHDCHIPMAHRDLKPGNVLLDADLCAHLSDFGLAKLIVKHEDAGAMTQTNSFGKVKGSIGYVAPEYATGGLASIYGDVYSFGILILEMFTGKRPTDMIFMDGSTLHVLAKTSLPDHVMDIVDPRLTTSTQVESAEAKCPNIVIREEKLLEQCLALIFRIGVCCSQQVPQHRMGMKEANSRLQYIRDNFFTK